MTRILGLFTLGTAIAALFAFIVQDLWGWFVVPLGVVALSYWHAWGVCSLVNVLTLSNAHVSRDAGEGVNWLGVTAKIVSGLIGWLMGWLLHFGVSA